MKKNLILSFAILAIIALVVFFSWLRNKYNEPHFPPMPTQQERDNAKKLPREKCQCWDGGNNICLPLADCI